MKCLGIDESDSEVASETEMYGVTVELRKKMQIANTETLKNFPENLAEIMAKCGLLFARDI